MLIIPAVDIKDGCVVRFVQGRLDKKVYSKDPLKTARHWVKAGARYLHIVDLDGSASGIPKNLNIVKNIAENISVPIQFGGGVRTIEIAKELFESGIKRVVLGTKAVVDRGFLTEAFVEFKERIIVSVDAKTDSVLIKGWQNSHKNIDLITFCLDLKRIGFKQIIYTDTLKDGTLSGPNIKGIKGLLKETGLKLIASGGVSSLNDLLKLKKLQERGLVGVIIGKALYEGKFTLSDALKLS